MAETEDHIVKAATQARLSALEAHDQAIYDELQLIGNKVDTVLVELRSRPDPAEQIAIVERQVYRLRLTQRIALPTIVGLFAVLFGVPPQTIAKAVASVAGWL